MCVYVQLREPFTAARNGVLVGLIWHMLALDDAQRCYGAKMWFKAKNVNIGISIVVCVRSE